MFEAKKRPKNGFLARLRKDTSGNVAIIVGATIIPMVAMIGGGVDMSRSYLVKARLQQACDAGALVARKSMGAGGLTTQGTTRAKAFFDNNFPPAAFGTSQIEFNPVQTADGNITANAKARIPMTIMTFFGNDHTDITVRCDAKLEISNTDVMFVLDTTGSMLDSGGSGTKIQGLREAVMIFFDVLDGAVDPTAQLRYGLVPYSSTVNMGSTNMPGGILPPDWIVNEWAYQSRDAEMTRPAYANTPTSDTTTQQVFGSSITSTQCSEYGRNRYPGGSAGSPVNSGTAPGPLTVTSYTNNASSGVDWGWSGSDTSGTTRSCRRRENVKTYPFAGYTLNNWIYQQSSLDVSGYKLGNAITIATAAGTSSTVPAAATLTLRQLAQTGTNVTTANFSWNGCIEERDTVAESNFSPIPSGALDLAVDSVPTNDDERWRPMFPEMVYDRASEADEVTLNNNIQRLGVFSACPSRSRKLGAMTRGDLQTYVNNLVAVGGTYHDTGFLWGLRLMSPTGIFAAENTNAPNGKPISRHIIFMSDGAMAPDERIYGLYGNEKFDRRITGSSGIGVSNMTARHNARFLALCEEAKERNITVWTIAFGTGSVPTLVTCADPGKALVANTNADLASQFSQIATKIAQLRLAN